MCRYGLSGPYKRHLACHKGFKRAAPAPRRHVPGVTYHAAPCPDCGRHMAGMGLDFKPPERADVEHWEVVAHLFGHGVAYHSCGCGGPGHRPSRWADVPAFLASESHSAPGAALAARFAASPGARPFGRRP